ncbi:MAG: glycoside hydrolase family 20 protein [Bacteroidales bacterium]|nr:glycoside hydrolase family 20 protein [Bacteroidales bacterium]
MRNAVLILAAVALLATGCNSSGKKVSKILGATAFPVAADYRVVPLPDVVSLSGGRPFELDGHTPVFHPADGGLKREAEFLAEYLGDMTDSKHKVAKYTGFSEPGLYLRIDTALCPRPESYRIDVDSSKVVVSGADAAGVFYGIQTLRKSLPVAGFIDVAVLPAGTVEAAPRFPYRGMHLDVGRHFFTIDSVKRYIDIMAMHNINIFHWHLTEDQGWRVQIDKYPRLTEVGTWRTGTTIGRNTHKYDNKRHGGFYTKKQMREIVDYAAERHIKVIPEFDLPGHTQSLLAAYPQFGCTGGPYEVWRRWGVSDEVVCAGNEQAMQCLEDILNEIMDIFPSDIIHIGGDECPKTRWHECPKCQAKIRELKIKGDSKFSAEDYLQSYVMNRMEKVVKARGRKIIGWDEILDGDVSQSAIIMAWRNQEAGVRAAEQGHDVVMTPCGYLYFSQGQSLEPENEPVFADGYLPVERAYSFDPVPDNMTEEAKKHIVGVQGCVWGEYAPWFSHVEYDALPRMAALSEIQWRNTPERDYQDFVERCFKLAQLYDLYDYNYAGHIFGLQVDIKPDSKKKCIVVTMSNFGEGEIIYSLDGSDPKHGSLRYTGPVEIRENADFRAKLVRRTGEADEYACNFRFSKSSMKPITLKHQPDKEYAFDGAPTLIDGLHGGSNYRSGRWLGFWGKPVEAVIDLGTPTAMSSVAFSSIIHINDWIYNPKSFSVMVSDDGRNYKTVASKEYPLANFDTENCIEKYELNFNETKARYVKVLITGHQLPEQHTGYGHPAWLFVDEIEVE